MLVSFLFGKIVKANHQIYHHIYIYIYIYIYKIHSLRFHGGRLKYFFKNFCNKIPLNELSFLLKNRKGGPGRKGIAFTMLFKKLILLQNGSFFNTSSMVSKSSSRMKRTSINLKVSVFKGY